MRLFNIGSEAIDFAVPEPIERIFRNLFVFILLIVVPALAMWGALLPSYGLPLLLRDDPCLFGCDGTSNSVLVATLNSASLYTHGACTFFAGMFWLLAAIIEEREDQRFMMLTWRQELSYIVSRTLPISALMLLLAYFPGSPIPSITGFELLRAVLGIAFGLGLILLFTAASRLVAHRMHWRRRYVLFGMLASLIVALHFWPKLVPIISIFKLGATLSGIYFFCHFFAEGKRLLAAAVLLGLIITVGSLGNYKYTINNLESLYDKPVELIARPLGIAERPMIDEKAATALQRAKPAAALDKFYDRQQQRGELHRPWIVVVAASGGAYRAAFWTGLVLDQLHTRAKNGTLTGLPDHIRLLTGASGGMVGAAYFAALPPDKRDRIVDQLDYDILERQKDEAKKLGRWPYVALKRDSLSHVLQRLVTYDILTIGLPGLRFQIWPLSDRGKLLQGDWASINTTFEQLHTGVLAGTAPSIIFSPMVVETGQPLMISNLDLRDIADDRELRAQLNATTLGQETGRGQVAGLGDQTAPRHAIDFFSTFPSVFNSFTLQTATRLNATFPFVSPAVSLPTSVERHVVDAGYFDNYGLTTALAYLRLPEVIKWLGLSGHQLAGALVVQINAFPVLGEHYDEPPKAPNCQDLSNAEHRTGVEWLTTPLEGLAAARERSMVYRGEQALASLKALYQASGLRLERIVLENSARSSFSWYLPDKELDCMRAELAAAHNSHQLKRLEDLWRDPKAN